MINTLAAWFPLLSFVLPLIALNVYFVRETYKQNVAALEMHQNAVKILPRKGRFLFAWSVYYLGTVIPVVIVLWLLPINKGVFLFMLYLLPVFWASNVFLAYPHYTLLIDGVKLSGAPLWGWNWNRIEIDIREIDKQKVLLPTLGKSLGIIVLKSTKGSKVLTLGLDNSQINVLFDYASINPQ